MNDLLLQVGIEGWKPVFNALLMPPVPSLLLAFAGLWLLRRQRQRLGSALGLAGLASAWFSMTIAGAHLLASAAMPAYAPLDAVRQAALRAEAAAGRPAAVIVLGAGRDRYAPEYGGPSLTPLTMERLRYGAWLARRLDLPLGYTGGVGHGATRGPAEADVAEQVAAEQFSRPLRWSERRSRDTRENGRFTVELLQRDGIRRAVIVTHEMHMARSMRAFTEAAAAAGAQIEFVPAPVGMALRRESGLVRWLPSADGLLLHRYFWHEKLGWWAGA